MLRADFGPPGPLSAKGPNYGRMGRSRGSVTTDRGVELGEFRGRGRPDGGREGPTLTRLIQRAKEGERGAYAVLFAILLVAIFAMVALVVDLGQARAERRFDQSVTDLAALAASQALAEEFPNPREACELAWEYLKNNVPDLPAGASMPCTSFPLTCSNTLLPATTPRYDATGEDPPYVVYFGYPVVNSDPYLGSPRSQDGSPCDRLLVSLQRTRDTFFAGVIGVAQQQIDAIAIAMGRYQVQTETAPALLLLEPTGCDALVASGQARVHVFSFGANPGSITVDSDGTKPNNPNVCGNNNANRWTVDAEGTQNSEIKACGNPLDPLDPTRCDPGGVIALFAMDVGQTTCLTGTVNHACDPADVTSNRLFPQPTKATKRNTRSPVDHAFNCKAAYDPYQPYATFPGLPISKCPFLKDGRKAYIDQLRTAIGTSGLPNGGVGFTEYTACDPTSDVVIPPGNYFVNCDTFDVGADVTFQGGNIVFKGNIDVTGGGNVLRVNTNNPTPNLPDSCNPHATGHESASLCPTESSAKHAYIYMRDGDIDLTSGGSLDFRNTAVYIHQGAIDVLATSPLKWHAPLDEGPFRNLSLWAEWCLTPSSIVCTTGPASREQYRLGGQAVLDVEGVFFTPFGDTFRLAGQADQFLDKAQFFSFRMLVTGLGTLRMQPDPARNITPPDIAHFLIR